MNRLKSIARNLRLILSQEINEQIGAQINQLETRLTERSETYERALHERASTYERAVDERIDERIAALERRADAYESALDARLEERIVGHETRLDERMSGNEKRNDERWVELQVALDVRFDERQAQLDRRADERQTQLETLSDERQQQLETRTDERQQQLETRLETRFDERADELDQRLDGRLRAIDNRIDDRFARVEKQIDARFKEIDVRLDARLEARERKLDHDLKQNREDIIDRTDIMLQVFEQRLDKQRRELAATRSQFHHRPTDAPVHNNDGRAEAAGDLAQTLRTASAAEQITSFRRLTELNGLVGTSKLQTPDAPLYHRILDWKKVAHEGLNNFTLDEKEVVDYILSFIRDEGERHYVMQHMRRLLGTLQRIPPPQSSTDRLLELGSLAHIVPAIKKFCGYNEVYGADVWEGEEKVSRETLTQTAGKESVSYELRNFDVESDRFPYPDDHFRVVLCCELIEHLRRDPMHMLWECNRVLAPDGFLLLTTPNVVSTRSIEGVLIGCTPYLLSQYNRQTPADQHYHEYAPYEIGIALAAAGFTVVDLETEDVWLRSNPAILELLAKIEITTDLRGDNIFALARKSGAPVERYPKELYVD